MPYKLRTIVLEDEIDNREWLINKLQTFAEIEIIGWAESVDDAFAIIAQQKPDVAFMDVQLIGGDAFQLLSRLNQHALPIPYIVMTTGYPNYIFTALNDYHANIVQYIVKPFVENWQEKLRKSIDALLVAKANDTSSTTAKPVEKLNYIFINNKGTMLRVNFDQIVYLESAGSGDTIMVTDTENYQLDYSLSKCLDILPEEDFFRISRTNIVRIERILRIYREERTIDVRCKDKTKNLGVGNYYYSKLLQKIPTIKGG